MSMHIEWTHGVGRVFDGSLSFANHDSFFSVMSIDKIGPDCVLVSADLTQRKLKKSDIESIYQALKAAGFALMHCWRKVGKRVPRGARNGRILRTVGDLSLWEIEL